MNRLLVTGAGLLLACAMIQSATAAPVQPAIDTSSPGWLPARATHAHRAAAVSRPYRLRAGARGTFYVFSAPAGEPHYLYALSSTGAILWRQQTIVQIFNSQLRMGPDGTLYYSVPTEVGRWVPVATAAGGPVPRAEQRRQASRYQPLPGGLRLVRAFAQHEARFALIDEADRIVRAWRITSRTRLWPGPATPALIGHDLVVALDVTRQTKSDFLLENLVVRLGRTGGTRQIVSLDPHAVVVVDTPITGLRVGPDGALYQLRSDPAKGVSIARYSLRPTPAPPAAPAEVAEPAGTAPSVATRAPAAPVVQPARPATPGAADEGGRWLVPLAAALGAAALLALGIWLVYRRRGLAGLPT